MTSDALLPPKIRVRIPASIGVNIDDIGMFVKRKPPAGSGVGVVAYEGATNVIDIMSHNKTWLSRVKLVLGRYEIGSNSGADA